MKLSFSGALALAPLALLTALALALPAAARAQAPDTFQRPTATAAAAQGDIAIDGRLDEAAWLSATPITGLRQYQPTEGAAASLATELRVLYGDDALFIGARMAQPDGVVAPLARRDQLLDADGNNGSFNSLTTDKLIVLLDPYHNRLDEVWFEVNPAGVKGDQFNGDPSWDPIWEAAARVDADGWTAEMRIPYSQLRFSAGEGQTWGMQVWRYIDDRNEQDMWAFRGRNEAGGPAFFGDLAGLVIDDRPRQMEILPYVVTGSTFEPADPDDPYHDGSEARFSAGGDLKVLLTSSLTLDATINPDFGQVEVDPASLNLSAFETYYDEKRPFFIAGASAFSFGGMRCMFCSNTSGLSAFYSRRIGRPPQLDGYVDDVSEYADTPDNTRILGAAKITGRTSRGWTVGLLDAVTSRETATFLPAPGDPEAEQVVEPFSNYFVGRLKKELRGGATTVGGIVTSVIRNTDDPVVAERLRGHAEAAGFDWRHTWAHRQYSWMGNALFSNVGGSADAIAATQRSSARYYQRPDREAVTYDPTATSLRGYGLFTRVGKDNGFLLWEGMANIKSPGFEVNDLAFLGRADHIWLNGNVGFNWTDPTDWYRTIFTSFGGATEWDYDGNRTQAALQTYFGLELPNYWNVRSFWIHNPVTDDVRATRGGPVVLSDGINVFNLNVSTDARKTAVFDFGVQGGRSLNEGTEFINIRPGLALKPAANIFIQLGPSYSHSQSAAQYVDTVEDPTAVDFYGSRYVFGYLETTTLSLNTRVNWTFTPDLTLQLFAQPFIASGDYSSFREFAAPRTLDKVVYGEDMGTIAYDDADNVYTVDPDGAGPAAAFTFDNPDFTARSLRGTAVLRWEYRPGSTLYFVWTQERSGFAPIGEFDFGRARSAMFRDQPLNVFQIKATYWLGR